MSGNLNWSPGKTIEEVEKEVIFMALRFFSNNKTVTANALGIAPRTLDYKLAKYRGENPEDPQIEELKSMKRKNGSKVSSNG